MSFLSPAFDAFGPFVATPYSRDQYVFEIRDADGILLRYFRDITAATLEGTIRGPARLSLTARLDNPGVAALAGWNELWIRRKGEDGPSVSVVVSEMREDPASGTVDIVAHDALYQLTVERVREYERTGTVAAIVADWFAAQESTRPLTIGGIDAAIGTLERTWEVTESDTLLHALGGLEETLPTETMWYVDPQRRFWWAPILAGAENQLIAGRNCLNVEREIRPNTVATRLYAFGANEGGRRVRLTDGGAAQDYVQDPLARWRYSRQLRIDHHDITPGATYPGAAGAIIGWTLAADTHLHIHAQPDGSDVAVYYRGAKLPHETVSYTPETGALQIKTGPLDVSAIRDTVLYLHYGGAADSGGSETLASATLTPAIAVGPPIAQPGIVPGEIVRPQVVDPAELLTTAQEALKKTRIPQVSYRVTLADLEALKRHPSRAYSLGRLQHVVDVDRGWDVDEAIVRLERDLLNPARVTIDLGRLYDREPLEVALAEDAEIDDDTRWLSADDVIISREPSGDWPGGIPARLRDWEHADAGWIDGAKIKGLEVPEGSVHRHRIAEIVSSAIVGTRRVYTVSLWEIDGSGPESPEVTVTGCVVPDPDADEIDPGAMVWVYLPTDSQVADGAVPVVVTAVAFEGAPNMFRHSHSGDTDGGFAVAFGGLF